MPDDRLPALDELAALVESHARDPAPATQLRVAIRLGRELTDLGDAVIGRFVAEAREAGLSWTEIGQSFGISKQAVQQRYGSATDAILRRPERWSSEAQRALERAAEQARELGHDYVGTEHALLALVMAERGSAANVLRELGVTRERMLSTSCMKPETAGRRARQAPLSVMPRLKQALENSQRLAGDLGASVAGSEHLLAGIVAVRDSMAVEILRRLGVRPAAVLEPLAQRLEVQPQQLGAKTRRRRRHLFAASR